MRALFDALWWHELPPSNHTVAGTIVGPEARDLSADGLSIVVPVAQANQFSYRGRHGTRPLLTQMCGRERGLSNGGGANTGDGAAIAAVAVVRGTVVAKTIVGGIPARAQGHRTGAESGAMQ